MTKSGTSGPSRAPRRNPLLYGAVVVLVGALLVLLFRPFTHHRPRGYPPASRPAETAGLTFRDDGTLTFSDAQGSRMTAISVEIAETEEARTQGLMGRASMSENQGMLFIFDAAEQRSFWMANTPLPLDILFIGADRRILNIAENTVPYSEESLPSTGPAQFVVEVNGGFCGRHGIGAGVRVDWLRH
jgi:uncharacterized protein